MERIGRIVVDLQPGADPIAGRVCADGQHPHAFTGWTGLFAVLRAVTSQDGRPQTMPRDSAGKPDAE